MTINRMFKSFGLLVAVGLLAMPVAVRTFGVPPIVQAAFGQGASSPNLAAAEQARLAQRRGEWYAGSESIYAPLDVHDRHPVSVSIDPEIQRFVAYSNSASAALAEQAQLAQRRGEWYAGSESIYAPLDAHDRHPVSVSIDPEIQRFVAYSNSASAALAEQARLAQWRATQ